MRDGTHYIPVQALLVLVYLSELRSRKDSQDATGRTGRAKRILCGERAYRDSFRESLAFLQPVDRLARRGEFGASAWNGVWIRWTVWEAGVYSIWPCLLSFTVYRDEYIGMKESMMASSNGLIGP